MVPIPGSVRLTGFAAPSDASDTYAVTDETYNRGGYRTVADAAALTALALLTDRLLPGMLVKQLDTGAFYTWDGANFVTQTFSSPGLISIFGDPLAVVTLTTSGALDPALPPVVIPASFFPVGLTLKRAAAIVMFRKVENTNGAVNKLSGDQYIQVQKGAGALTNAIKFVDDELKTPLLSEGSGDAIIGSIDVKATVDADNATYNFQWTDALTDQDSLLLHDVRTGFQFYFG
jgi:hypothetical protein